MRTNLSQKTEKYSNHILFKNDDTPLNLFNWIISEKEKAYEHLKNNDKFKNFFMPPNSTCDKYICGIYKGMPYNVELFINSAGELWCKISAFSELHPNYESEK